MTTFSATFTIERTASMTKCPSEEENPLEQTLMQFILQDTHTTRHERQQSGLIRATHGVCTYAG